MKNAGYLRKILLGMTPVLMSLALLNAPSAFSEGPALSKVDTLGAERLNAKNEYLSQKSINDSLEPGYILGNITSIIRARVIASTNANSVYARVGGKIMYSDEKFGSALPHYVKKSSRLYVDGIIKNASGDIVGYKVDYGDGKDAYVKKDSVLKTVSEIVDMNGNVYKGVDYEPIAKTEGFAGNPRVKVRGVYVTAANAATPYFDEIIKNARANGFNAVVIDFKDDMENFLFRSEAAERYNPGRKNKYYVSDSKALMKKIRDNGMYAIARVVTFKSPVYAKTHPEKAIVDKKTKSFLVKEGMIWASPYDRNLWEYNTQVALEAARSGFNEVQFDYVRFPATSRTQDSGLDFRNAGNEIKPQAVQGFLLQARERLELESVYVSADVFGWTASDKTDVGIGQHWEAMSNAVDYMCPMVYPSHYGPGNYGFAVPDAHPYGTVKESVKDAQARNANISTPSSIRPWIQDFTATWVAGHIAYGEAEVKAQIKALKDVGIDEFILWNQGSKFHYKANSLNKQ